MSFPTQEHIDAARLAAARVMAKTGFYCWPSVTLAQALIESAGWTKLSGKNNGFGIKANDVQRATGKATLRRTREVVNGKSVYIDDWFADFDNLADAYEQHAMLFVRVGVYKEGLKAKNAEDFIKAIGPHYATDPKYVSTIISIMRQNGYYKYDGPNGAVKAEHDPAPVPDAPAPKPPAPALSFLQWLASLFKRAA